MKYKIKAIMMVYYIFLVAVQKKCINTVHEYRHSPLDGTSRHTRRLCHKTQHSFDNYGS